MKFTVQYLDGPHATVRFSSDLFAESARAAEVSANIGFRWAQNEHGARCYRVLNDAGEVLAIGPEKAASATLC